MGVGSCLLRAGSPLPGARPLMAVYIFSWNIFAPSLRSPELGLRCYGDPLGKMHTPDFMESSESLEHNQLGIRKPSEKARPRWRCWLAV